MPIYTTSYGKRYNIPSDIAAQFEKDFPDARIRYEASGEEYDIPLNKRDGFIKAFPNAKTVDRMSTPPKEDAQPEYSGPGGYFAPTTRHEPNPSALIAEEVERQQREAGINPNSAEAISQRFDAMIEALPTSATKKYDDQVLREDYRRREEQYNKTHRLGMMQAQNPEGYAPYPQRSDDEKTNSRFLPLANVGDETSAVWMIPQPEDYPAPSPEAQRIWERRINEAKAQSQFESGVRGQLWEITKTLDEQDRKNDEKVRQWREESHKRALDGLGALPIPPSTPEESRSYSNLKTAQGLLDEAVKVIEQADRNTHGATGVGNALRGIKDGLFDPHTWDLGIGELVDANNLRRVIAKSDRNETLTDDERSLLDALATNMAVSSLYGSKVGMGYNIGKGTAQSLPFMIEFALNPIAGSSKTIAGKIARYWLKHNAKGKALKKAGARVIGDIAAATGTMATSGSLRTAADAITRTTGNPLYEITPEGKAVYAGHEQGDTPLKAIGKSATAGSIEYYTELLGGAFGPIGRAVGGVLGKVPGMKSITGYLSRSQAAELIRGIRTSDWAKSVGDFTSRTGWHGMVEEYSEEEIGNILNYFTVGDVQKKDLLDPQQHLETFGSVALMGGFFSALKTAGYRPARSRAQKQVAILNQQAGDLLGEEWQNIKAACDNNNDAQSGTAALAQVLESSQYNPEQKRAILSYFAAKQSYNGVLLADQKSSEEQTKSPEQTAIENSYDAGYKSVDGDPSAKQAIKQHLDQVSAPFSEERLQQLRAVENPMQYISEHPQEAPQLLGWFKANSTYTGMIEAVQDQINQKIKESDDAVDSRTHTDGNLYTITLKGDNAAQGYITQGDVAFNPDGSVNKTKSNDRVTVRYADGHSEMLSIDDLGRLVETNNAQELKAQNADAIWEEESRRAAAEIDGTTGPSQGDPITLKDGRRGIFYADTGDGNYLVQLEDGSVIPAPQTAVTLLNRQPSQQQPTLQPAQTTPQQTAEQTMTPSPAQEPQNGVDNRIGRSLNKEEADNLIAEMENRAEPAPELELTPENWTAEFGEDGMVDTPIGKVKMGENQYLKLAQKGRNGKLGMIKPTLTNPDVIIEDKSQAKEGQQTERPSSYVFVKSFIDETGDRRYYFTSVTISKEGNEVVISNQEKSKDRIIRLMEEGKPAYIKKATLPSESATSAQGNRLTIPGGATLQDKNTNSSANFQTNTTDNQPQNGVDNRIGRSLNKEEADDLITEMENRAEPAPELELTPENWTAEFGEDGMVDTPIGKVKMGENQYQKLVRNKRENYFGMIKPTLESPDMVVEKVAPADNAERDTKLIFVKTFTKPDGSRVVHFQSVTVKKDGLEVSISSHEAEPKDIKKDMQNATILHISEKMSHGSEGSLTEAPVAEGPDLVPTSDNLSTNEDTTPFAENQITAGQNNTNTSPEATQPPAEVTYPRDEKTGHILFDQIDDPTVVAAALRNEFGEQALEAAQTKLQDLQGELEKAASTKDTFERLYKQRDLQREIAKYQQVVSTLTPTEVEQITPQEMNRAEVQPENAQNETNRSEQQGQETTNADTQTSNADQSEVDENGRPFVKDSDGSTVFGEITEDTGLTPAPIKLSEGYQDGNGKGYGRAHIEANHGKQIKKAGFSSVEDFVSYVAKNYNRDNILVGKRRNNGQPTFLIQVSDQHDNTLFVELSGDESYWNVNSAGIFRKGYSNNKETVAKTEPQQPINAVSGDSSLSENEQSGISLSEPNGESTVSTNEDTTNIQENQKSASKNTENQTNPPTNKVNTPILPRKQTAPKYAKEIAQFGDEVSIEDVVLRDIALGQKFSWEDHGKSRGIASELGFTGKEAERRSRISMLRNDGITVDDYVHGLWQEYGERFRQDDTQIRDAVLDVLQRVYSPKAAMEQLRNIHTQEEFSQEEQNILTPEEQDAFGNAPVSEYAFREPEATTPEEQQIIDQAKQNGTYMKAPNGKPTNLTAAQWVKVRTQAFKNWFGDWEKIAKLANSKHKGNERNRSKQAPEYSDDFRRVQARSKGLSKQEISEFHRAKQDLNESDRELLSRVFRRELFSKRNRNRYAQRTLIDPKQNIPVQILEDVDGQLFHDIFEIVRNYLENGELVDLHENYDNATCYLAADGLSGFAVEDNGNLVSVFNLNPKIKFLRTIKDYVTECGATHLDGYNSPEQPLAKIYQKTLGWKVASLMDYNMEFDHDDIAANHDAPQVAFMVDMSQDVETKSFDKDSYDEAEAYQQEQVKAIFKNCSKVIDENGEPLAVHPVPSSTNTTDEGSGNDQQTGLYFETGGNEAGDRSRQAYFLNIRDPKYSSTQGDISNTSHDGAILQSQQPGETPLATTYAVVQADQIRPTTDLNEERSSENPDTRYRNIDEVNDQFNAELQQQIEGSLPQGHIYRLGHPSEALQAAGIPNLPIELAASRLSDKSMQANHPFELSEIENLPEAIQQPLAVFRSATHIGSYVVMTEIEHQGKNYVAAIQTHRQKGRLEINDIRSIHYRRTNTHMVNWIDEGLLEYVDKQKMVEWLSKQRYNSAEVRKLFNHATNIVNSFENPTLTDGKKVATAEELSETLHTPIRIVRNVNDIHDDEKEALRKRRAYGWYDMETGEVVIVLPNCRDEAEVQATILHEVVGHKGLRELVGEEKYNDLLRRVWSSLDPATKAKKQKQYGHPLIAADEYLASLAEENVEPNVLKRISAQVRNWLREVLGMDIKLSDNDLRYLLWRSKHNLQNKQNIFERAETAAKDAELRYRLGINNRAQAQTENSGSTELDAVNRRFNEQLETLTEKNAQSVILNLGRPNTVLQSAGIADRPIRLYGNKVMKKIRKHGFKITDIKNLPSAINNPIAVFNNYGNKENRAVFTELATSQGNVLVTIEWGKGTDAELNIVTSVFGKGNSNIIDWINSGYTTYINKEKALNYLRISALIAEAQDNQELSLATNIIKNFENPTLPSEENIRFREQDTPSDLPTSQVSSSQEKLREELKHLRTLRKGLDSEVMQYRKRGAQNESSSTRQLKDIIARYNRSQRQIREYVNDILDAQAATSLGKREINTLLSALVRATDPQKAEQAVHRILDTVTTARLRAETARTEKLYSTKIQGETPQGVPEAKGVDDNTRVMIEYFRAHKEKNINESEEALRTKQATEGLTPTEQMHMDAIYLIRLYQQATEVGNDYMAASAQMEQLEQQIDTLSKEVWHLQRAKATGGEARRKRTIEQKQQTMVQKGHLLEATRWQLQELKQNYLEQLQGFNDILQEVILNGRSAYLDWVHKQQDRQREILQGAFADAGPKAMASARQYGGWKPQGPLHKSVLAMRDFFTAPLLSLDYLIRKHTQSAPNGEGHLYNQFIRGEGGYMEASNRYFERTREITDALGEAAQRYMGVSGKNMGQRWLRAQAQARRSPLTFSLQLNDGSQPQVISATQALYLRALEKQTDGQVKLRAMGISEEVMEQISQTLQQEAPEMVALADWVQEQLLPSLRESYNATHLRLFGIQMREVAHYFPISINKRETYQENDGTEHEQTLPTTTTGSIISRKPNTTAIDWNMDFFEVLDRHIQQMEHWNAYSEVVQNMNRLTSNTLFKKSLEYKNPGEARKFMDAARVAAEQYRIQVLDHESVIVKLSQAAASSKINFRGWTAIKQIASSPAFVAYSADPQFWATLSKHVATLPATLLGRGDYSWAKANLPDFRRRVQGGTAGNDALERESFSVVRKLSKDPRSPLSYGMWANAHMDAVVCAMGAKAVYEYQLSRHKRRGLSESEAQRAARRDAELSYNLSQQSALGVNLSPMQRSRNFFSVIFSTFQNAQFLYGRQLGDALRELTRSTELETEALYQRYRTQGMESAQARRAALKDVSLAKRTSVVRILTYGWGLQLLWVAMSNALPYIFGGDDDDKNLWVESAKNPAVWIGPLQGLFGGGNLTSIAEGYPFGGPMLFEDISRFWRNYGEAAQSQGIFSWETAGVTLDLLTEFSLSQNSETFMNLYNGVQAFIDGHSTAGLLQLINAPRSQIKKILLQRGEHESLMQYAERINNLQELFRAIDRSAQGAQGTSYPLYEELEQAN